MDPLFNVIVDPLVTFSIKNNSPLHPEYTRSPLDAYLVIVPDVELPEYPLGTELSWLADIEITPNFISSCAVIVTDLE